MQKMSLITSKLKGGKTVESDQGSNKQYINIYGKRHDTEEQGVKVYLTTVQQIKELNPTKYLISNARGAKELSCI
jgi:hypothetical protein